MRNQLVVGIAEDCSHRADPVGRVGPSRVAAIEDEQITGIDEVCEQLLKTKFIERFKLGRRSDSMYALVVAKRAKRESASMIVGKNAPGTHRSFSRP
jgi:hypothetical protein